MTAQVQIDAKATLKKIKFVKLLISIITVY